MSPNFTPAQNPAPRVQRWKEALLRAPRRPLILRGSIAALAVCTTSLWLPSAISALFYWDGDANPVGNSVSGAGLGGTGNWDNALSTWWNGTTDVNWTDQSGADTAVFTGASGTVTINTGATGIVANALRFDATGYTLAGATPTELLTLAGPSPTITVTNAADTATISATLGGSAGFTKSGNGKLRLTEAGLLTGAVSIAAGTLELNGNGSLATATGGVTLSNRSVLTLDNTATNLGDRIEGPITSSGGTINFLGNAAAATTETAGVLTLSAGALTINSTPGAGGSTLTLASISRAAGGTLYLNGAGLGGGTNQVVVTTQSALTNTILPWAVVNNGSVVRFATHGGDGTSLAAQTAGYTAAETAWTANTVNALGGTQALTGNRVVYSLTLDSGVNLTATTSDRSLTIGSGGVGAVLQTGGTSTIGQTGTIDNILAFGANEAVFHILGTLQTIRADSAAGLTGTGGLTKSGAGTLILGGQGTLTGTYRINEGILESRRGDALGTTQPLQLNGGMWRLTSDSATTFTSTITVNADSAIQVDRLTAAATATTHTVGTLSIGGGRRLTITSNDITAGTSYGLTTGTLTVTAGGAIFDVANNGTGVGTMTVGTVSAGGNSITKVGTGDLVTNSATTGWGAGPISVLAGHIGWSNNTIGTNLAESSIFTGAGGIFKTGDSTVTLSGASTFTGEVSVTDGVLAFSTVSNSGGAASNLGQGTDGITLTAGTNLTPSLRFIGGASQTTNRLVTVVGGTGVLDASGTGGATISYTGGATTGGNAITLDGSGEGFIGAIIQTSNTADINKNGSGKWTLTSVNVVADDIIVNAGTLVLAAVNLHPGDDIYSRTGGTIELGINGALNASGVDALYIADSGATGATFDLKGFTSSVNAVQIGQAAVSGNLIDTVGTGVLTVGSVDLRAGSVSADLAFSGTSGLSKTSVGTAIVSGTNTFGTGGTTLNLGNLVLDYGTENTAKINATAALTGAGGQLTIYGNASAATDVVVSAFTLNAGQTRLALINGTGQSVTLSLGTITRAIGGAVDFALPSTGNFITAGAVGLVGGWATVGQANFARRDASGFISALVSTAKDDIATWATGDNVTDSMGYYGTIAGAANISTLLFASSGTSTVTVASPSGILGISSGGVLITSAVGSGTVTMTGGTLISGVADVIFHQNNTGAAATVNVAMKGTTGLTKVGNGLLQLSGTSSSTGAVNIQVGTLQVTGGNALGDAAAVTLDDGNSATLQLLASETIGTLAGGGGNGGAINLGVNTLTINETTGTTYSGVISGTAASRIVKNGIGTLALGNTNNTTTFLGAVTINAGLLHLDNVSTSLAGASSFILNGGELLSDQDQGASVDRIGNSATILLNNTAAGRGLWFRNENQDSTRSDTVGVVTLGAGHNVIASDINGGTSTSRIGQLTIGGLLRGTSHGTALLRGQSLGQTANGRGQILMAADLAGAIGGGGAAGSTTISIHPWLIGEAVANTDNTLADNYGNSFVYDADTSAAVNFRPLNLTTEYVVNQTAYDLLAAGILTNNVRFDTTTGTLATDTTGINALVIDSGTAAVNVTGASGLQITSGAILSTGTNASSLSGFTGLTMASTNDFIIYVTAPTGVFTLNSALATANALVKSGAGTLVLGAASNGNTDVYFNQGTVQASSLAQLGSGALNFFGGTLKFGAAFDPSSKTITFDTGGGTFDTNAFDITLTGSLGSGSGGFTKIGAGVLRLNAATTQTGSTTISLGSVILGANQAIGTGDLTVGGGATFDMSTFDAAVANLTVTNAANVLSGSGKLTVSGTATVNRGTIAPQLAGAMNLIKQTGGQTVTLSNVANSFTGYTHVQDGTLSVAVLADEGVVSSLGAPTAASGNSDIRLGNGTTSGTLLYTGPAASTNRVISLAGTTGGGLIDNDGTGALTLTGNVRDTDYGAKTLTLQGTAGTTAAPNVLSGRILQSFGTITVSKTEAGVWQLTGANTYTGQTNIGAGTLIFDSLSNLGLGTVIQMGGGTLRWNAANTTDISARTVTFTGTANFDTNGNDVTLANAIGGTASFGLTKTGAGTLYLQGTNAFAGTTTINGGVVKIDSEANLGTATNDVTFANGATLQVTTGFTANAGKTFSFTAAGGGTVQVDAGTLTLQSAVVGLTGTGGLIKTGAGTLALTVSSLAYDSTGVGVSGATGVGFRVDAGTLLLQGTSNSVVGDINPNTMTVQLNGGNLAIQTDTASIARANLYVSAAGTLTVDNATAGAGTTQVIGTGTGAQLTIGTGATILTVAGGANVTSGTAVAQFNSATLLAAPTFNILNPTGATMQLTLGAVTGGANTITLTGNGSFTQTGIFTSTGGFTLGTTFSGLATLSQVNAYSGATTVNGGTLSFATSSQLGDGTTTNVLAMSGGTLRYTGSGALDLTANRALTVGAGGATLEASSATGVLTLSGGITAASAGPLRKTGAGAVNVTGAVNLNGGATTVSNGVLNAGFTSTGTAAIDITATGTLNLLDGATTTLTLGGTAGALTLSGGSTLGFELNAPGTSDKIVIGAGGSATVSGVISLNFFNLGGLAAGTYNLISAPSGLDGATFVLGSAPGGFNYNIVAAADSVDVITSALIARYWTGDQGASWATNNGGNTNFSTDAAGATDAGAIVSAGQTVIFSATNATGPAIVTTLDAAFAVDSLQFLAAPTGVNAVTINPGTGGTLALSPASSNNGIIVNTNAGVITIAAPLTAAAAQTWSVEGGGANGSSLAMTANVTFAAPVTKAGAGALTLSGTNSGAGGFTLAGGTVNLNSATALGTGVFTIKSGTTINKSTAGALTLSTNNVQEWDGSFTFTGSNSLDLGTGAVTLGANVVLTASGSTLTVGGVIDDGAGTFTLAKAGAGALTLTGANLHDGGTTLTAGLLNINNASALGEGTFTLEGGTFDTTAGALTLSTNNAQVWSGNFTFAGSNNLNLGTGAVALGTANRTVTTTAGNLTVGGEISGLAGFVKDGAGTLTLTAANAYDGTTTINRGTLAITANQNLSATTNTLIFGTSAGSTNVGTLNLNTASATFGGATTVQTDSALDNVITIGGGQTLRLNGAVTVGYNSAATSTTRLVVSGAGTLTIGALGAPTNANFQLGNGQTADFSNRATLDLSGLSTFYANLGTGTFRVGDPTNSSGTATGGSTLILAPTSTITATTITTDSPAGTVAQTIRLGTTANFLNANTIDIGGASNRAVATLNFFDTTGTLQVRNLATTGRAAMTVAYGGATTGFVPMGTVNLNGHNSDLLLSTLNIGGRTAASGSSSTGTFSFDTGTLDVTGITLGDRRNTSGTGTSTGTLNLGGGTTAVGASGILLATNTATATGNAVNATMNVSGNATVTVGATAGTSITLGRSITPGLVATATLNITGTSSLTVAGNIIEGPLATFAGNASVNSTITLDGGTLNMAGFAIGTAAETINTTNFRSGTVRALGQLNGGSGALNKTTTGTLNFDGANTFTAATTVSDGAVSVLASGSLSGTTVSVASIATLNVNGTITTPAALTVNGTLSGAGTITGAAATTTVSGTGTVSPGSTMDGVSSYGTLTTTAFSAATGSTLKLELGTSAASAYDRVATTSLTAATTLNAGGGAGMMLDVNASAFAFTLPYVDKFFIIVNGGSTAVAGTFANATTSREIEGTTYDMMDFDGHEFAISYTGDSALGSFTGGNDVVLMAVPEPNALAMLFGSLAMTVGLQRFRRRHQA